MANESDVLLKWTEPDFVAKRASAELKKGCWRKFFTMEVFVLVLLAVLYYLLHHIKVDPGYYMDKFFSGLLLAIGYPLLAFVIFPFLSGRSNRTIFIKEKRIIVQLMSNVKIYKWPDIISFKIIDSEDFPGSRVLELGCKGFTRKYHLAADVDERQLLAILATYADNSQESEPAKDIKFERWEKAFIALLTALFIMVMSYMVYAHGEKKDPLSKYVLSGVALMMFLGPGTFSVILLKGPKAITTRTGHLTFVSMNMLALCLSMLIVVISLLYKHSQFY